MGDVGEKGAECSQKRVIFCFCYMQSVSYLRNELMSVTSIKLYLPSHYPVSLRCAFLLGMAVGEGLARWHRTVMVKAL